MKKIVINKYTQTGQTNSVKFGTSGVRGLVTEMTDECCWLYVSAFIQHLKKSHRFNDGDKIAVAGDLRPSTPKIMAITIQAIKDANCIPVNCGFIPSPAVALYGMAEGIPSIMVTGSHIPDDRNGIKFNTSVGEILKKDEQSIIRQSIQIPEDKFDAGGMITSSISSGEVTSVALDLYIKRYIDSFPPQCLTGKKVGLFEHSSVASQSLKIILETLGAEVTSLGYSKQFIPVDTEAVRPEDVKAAKQWSQQYQFDTIISTDGDGDRPLVSDEFGNWLRGDILGILTASYLQAEYIATPINSNSAVEKCQLFEKVQRSRIGSPYVIEAMNSFQEKNKTIVGYEANGGFLLATPATVSDRLLAPLPTRDSTIVALAILILSIEKNKPISQLVTALPSRYTFSNRLKAFPPESSQKLLKLLKADSAKMAEIFPELAEVKDINDLDGLRFTLKNEEIVHFRPSGNAPEFRCYTEANSIERATSLNEYCMAKINHYR